MLSSRFFRRIFLPYLLLVCAVAVTVGAFVAVRVRHAWIERTRRTMRDESVLIAALLSDDLQAGRLDRVASAAERIGRELDCRITVIQADGTVVADTEADPAKMENHGSRTEILQAAADGDGDQERSSRTLGTTLLYHAHRLRTPDGATHYIRLSIHASALDRELRLIYGAPVGVVAVAAVLAGILCFHFARRSADPVVKLTEFARSLARGELHRRLFLPGRGETAQLATNLNTMADSLGTLLERSARDRAELLVMLESMSEGVIAADLRRRIVVVNRRAGEMLDFEIDRAYGRSLFEVVRDETILNAVLRTLETGRRTVFQVNTDSGTWLEITACTYPAGGPPQGLILVAHDTTQSVRYEELRKEFVANVSHELRTPLTVIKGFTETLRDGALTDPVNGPKFLATIERHVDQLTNLVSDLLELSKLEGTPDMPRPTSFDVGPVVRRAVELLLPAAQRKRQSLQVDVPIRLPRIIGNPDYIERAVSNLIDNAIKYTPDAGEIRVRAMAERESLVVEVADNGIGIPQPDLVRIFERFYRVDRSRSREMGGTGLGLSIVKHVAQVHGGSIEVSSTAGQGSQFRLKLPIPVAVSSESA